MRHGGITAYWHPGIVAWWHPGIAAGDPDPVPAARAEPGVEVTGAGDARVNGSRRTGVVVRPEGARGGTA